MTACSPLQRAGTDDAPTAPDVKRGWQLTRRQAIIPCGRVARAGELPPQFSRTVGARRAEGHGIAAEAPVEAVHRPHPRLGAPRVRRLEQPGQIGRAAWRDRGCTYV